MNYSLSIFFGITPSIIWLLYYLRKDVHPESKRMILKIFFWGMLIAIPAIFLELGFLKGLRLFNLSPVLFSFFNLFIGVAFVEEILKYSVVKYRVLHNSEFDEPLDAMLYMIIAALGFAAIENILILFSLAPDFLISEAFSISALRFLGATFLHTLSSGIIGYFLALSICYTKNRLKLLTFGIIIATSLHGLYNFSIIEIEGNLKFAIPIIILIGSAIFVTLGFKNLKKVKSICLPSKK